MVDRLSDADLAQIERDYDGFERFIAEDGLPAIRADSKTVPALVADLRESRASVVALRQALTALFATEDEYEAKRRIVSSAEADRLWAAKVEAVGAARRLGQEVLAL